MEKKSPTPKPVKSSKRQNWWVRIGLLLAIDALFIGVTLFMLTIISKQAEELRTLKIAQINSDAKTNVKIIEDELSKLEEKYSKTLSVFPTSDTILDFINQKEELKAKGVVSDFAFAGEEIVKDKLGLPGFPVLVQARGDQAKLNAAIEAINSLPFIIREVKVEVTKDASGSYVLRYGGFLYTE